nr:RNA polymerase sigma-70 factor [uncultured Bacteroides sp.]
MQDGVVFSINRKEVFEKLFNDYYGILVYYALKYVKRDDVAEDLVQDLFLSLWEKQVTFNSIPAFRSFLYTSIKNSALDYLKHEAVESQYIQDSLDKKIPLHDNPVQKEEVYRLLFSQIDKLPGRCREIFLLHLDGLSNEQIATKLSLSIETVKTQKKRAMKALKSNLIEKDKNIYHKILFYSLFLYLEFML